MNPWVIPYIDQPISFWEKVNDLYGDKIREVYFPMPGDAIPSGRPKLAEQYIFDFLAHAPLTKAVLINPIVLGQPIEEIGPVLVEALAGLRDRYGIKRVTITTPTVARLIREGLPEFKITASVLMGIATPAQVLAIRDLVDVIVPDTRLYRNLTQLQHLRHIFAGEVRLMVNESCLPGCLFRNQHFYEMAYSKSMPHSLCDETLRQYPWLRLTSGWILPQHLHYYTGLYDSLKISGRVTLRDPQRYLKVLGAYIEGSPLKPTEIGGGPASVIEPIEIADTLFEHLLNCSKDCLSCKYCENQYRQLTSAKTG